VAPGENVDRLVVIDKLKLGSKKGLKRRPVHASVFGSKAQAQAALAQRFNTILR
jgi:hypothetical protein